MYDFYRENILDHGMNPRNRGILDPADMDYEAHNPLCGDRLRLTLRLDEDRHIKELAWDGEGCAISQASASMLREMIIGKSMEEVRQIDKQVIFDLIGIPLSMNRLKCQPSTSRRRLGAVVARRQLHLSLGASVHHAKLRLSRERRRHCAPRELSGSVHQLPVARVGLPKNRQGPLHRGDGVRALRSLEERHCFGEVGGHLAASFGASGRGSQAMGVSLYSAPEA